MEWVKKHSPEILMALGLTAFTGAVVNGVFATKMSEKKIKSKEDELGRKLTKKEKFKTVLPYYIPVVLEAGLGTTMIIGGNRVSAKREVALVTAYTATEAALTTWKTKAAEVLTAKDTEKLTSAVTTKLMEDTPQEQKVKELALLPDNYIPEEGDTLFWEPLTGTYFFTSWLKLQQAEVKMQKIQQDYGDTITMDIWLDEIGIHNYPSYVTTLGYRTYRREIFSIRKDVVPINDDDKRYCKLIGNYEAAATFIYNQEPHYLLK